MERRRRGGQRDGQVIARLPDEDEHNALREAEAQLMKAKAERAGLEVELNARRQALPEVETGIGYERDFDERTIGPSLGVEVPLFDRGHAREQAAGARLERQRFLYEAVRQQASRDIVRCAAISPSRQPHKRPQSEIIP